MLRTFQMPLVKITMITLLVPNYLTRVQSESYFSSDANFNVIEKNGMIIFFLCAKTVGIRKQ